MKSTSFYAFISAVGVVIYIAIVATFMNTVPTYLKALPSILATMLFLSTFVFSAAVTSTLVFGRPVMWYLEGRKKEAVVLLLSTLGMFFAITLAVAVIFLILSPDSIPRISQ